MPKERARPTEADKARAVALYLRLPSRSGGAVRELERALGYGRGMIRRWARRAGGGPS